MRFQAEGAALSSAAKWAAQALPGRPPLPILSGMLAEVSPDGVTLSAYDSQVGTRVVVPVEADEPGRLLLPGGLFVQVLAALPSGPVEVELADGDGRAAVRAGGADFGLAVMPVEDYPQLPQLPQSCGSLDGQEFRSAVEAVAYATGSTNEVNELRIDGVRIEVRGDVITFVATDRFRIPAAVRHWEPIGTPVNVDVLVPPSALYGLAKVADGPVQLALPTAEGGVMALSCGGRTLTTGVFAGKYPDWRKFFSAPSDGPVAELDATELRGALKRAQLVLEPKKPVCLTLMDGCMQVDSGQESVLTEIVEARVEGDVGQMVCHFNPVYLLQALDAAPTSRVRLHLNGGRPALMTAAGGGADYRHVLMPQRTV